MREGPLYISDIIITANTENNGISFYRILKTVRNIVFKIQNPKGFQDSFLSDVGSNDISCRENAI